VTLTAPGSSQAQRGWNADAGEKIRRNEGGVEGRYSYVDQTRVGMVDER